MKKVGGSADLVKLAAVTDDAPEAWPWIDRPDSTACRWKVLTLRWRRRTLSRPRLAAMRSPSPGCTRRKPCARLGSDAHVLVFWCMHADGLAVAWLVVEVGIIRRIAELTRRARAVSAEVRSEDGAPPSTWRICVARMNSASSPVACTICCNG